MKKSILALVLILVFLQLLAVISGCSGSTPSSPATPTQTPVPPAPTATSTLVPGNYHLDTGLSGWVLNASLTGITRTVINSDPSYVSAGAGSIRFDCDFTGQTYEASSAGEIGYDYSAAPINLTGKTVSAYLYIPSSIISLTPYYYFEMYLKSPGQTGNGYVNNMNSTGWRHVTYSSSLYSGSVDLTQITYVGFRLHKQYSGTLTPDWSGSFYLDEITWY